MAQMESDRFCGQNPCGKLKHVVECLKSPGVRSRIQKHPNSLLGDRIERLKKDGSPTLETYQQETRMHENRIENPPTKTKKLWTAPAVTVIDLRSARNGAPAVNSDSGSNHRS